MAAPATSTLQIDPEEATPDASADGRPQGRPPGMRSCPGCGDDAIYVAAATLASSGPVVGEADGFKVHRGDDGGAYYHPS